MKDAEPAYSVRGSLQLAWGRARRFGLRRAEIVS
jgi:hypothetical protein